MTRKKVSSSQQQKRFLFCPRWSQGYLKRLAFSPLLLTANHSCHVRKQIFFFFFFFYQVLGTIMFGSHNLTLFQATYTPFPISKHAYSGDEVYLPIKPFLLYQYDQAFVFSSPLCADVIMWPTIPISFHCWVV